MTLLRESAIHIGYTRVVALPDIDDVDCPRLDELTHVNTVDLTCDLSSNGGMTFSRSTKTTDSTPWRGNHERQFPTRWSSQLVFTSWVPTQCGSCILHPSGEGCCSGMVWDLSCRFRCSVVIVVRRGCPWDDPWHVGQEVEVYKGRWGARSVSTLNNTAALFTVPVVITREAGFDPSSPSGCSGTTKVCPGTDPVPCDTVLCDICDSDTGECLVNCVNE